MVTNRNPDYYPKHNTRLFDRDSDSLRNQDLKDSVACEVMPGMCTACADYDCEYCVSPGCLCGMYGHDRGAHVLQKYFSYNAKARWLAIGPLGRWGHLGEPRDNISEAGQAYIVFVRSEQVLPDMCTACNLGQHVQCRGAGCLCHGYKHDSKAEVLKSCRQARFLAEIRIINALERQEKSKQILADLEKSRAANVVANTDDALARSQGNALADADYYNGIGNEQKGEFAGVGDAGDFEAGYMAYFTAMQEQRFARDLCADIALPGHLYNGRESCGQWKVLGCLESELHHNPAWIQKTVMHCNNKGCRICFDAAVAREAKAITNRMITFCVLKNNKSIYKKKHRARILLHTVLSPPPSRYHEFLTRDGRRKLRDEGLKILKQHDVDGGCMVDHPYRFSKKLKGARLSPHIHVIHTGWIDGKKAKETYEKTGWITTQISTLEQYKECYSLARYLLSHASVYPKIVGKRSSEHSVRYWGEAHNKKFKCADVLARSESTHREIRDMFRGKIEKIINKKGYLCQAAVITKCTLPGSVKEVGVGAPEHVFIDGVDGRLAVNIQRYLTPYNKDNAPVPQSVPDGTEFAPLDFLQVRVDYGHTPMDIVQSEYLSIILDPNLMPLCPECSLKMRQLCPGTEWDPGKIKKWRELLGDLAEKTSMPIDSIDDWAYEYDTRDLLGITYFDEAHKPVQDPGVYAAPDCMEQLNATIYKRVKKAIDLATFVYTFKLEKGLAPRRHDVMDFLEIAAAPEPRFKKDLTLVSLDRFG